MLPTRRNDDRICRTSESGAWADDKADGSRTSVPWNVRMAQSTWTPRDRRMATAVCTSCRLGTLRSVVFDGESRLAVMMASAEFLDPETGRVPCRVAPPRTCATQHLVTASA